MHIIDLDNQTALEIDTDVLEKIACSLTNKEIELIITDNTSIAQLNAQYRGKNTPTDVLSFPIKPALQTMPLGSIVISEAFVKEKARELGHSLNNELSLLFIHGLLHLLGFDHEVDSGEMREKEKEIIEAFQLPSSLIIRNKEF